MCKNSINPLHLPPNLIQSKKSPVKEKQGRLYNAYPIHISINNEIPRYFIIPSPEKVKEKLRDKFTCKTMHSLTHVSSRTTLTHIKQVNQPEMKEKYYIITFIFISTSIASAKSTSFKGHILYTTRKMYMYLQDSTLNLNEYVCKSRVAPQKPHNFQLKSGSPSSARLLLFELIINIFLPFSAVILFCCVVRWRDSIKPPFFAARLLVFPFSAVNRKTVFSLLKQFPT